EQHQELLLTDILHAFFTNPLRPAYKERDRGIPPNSGVTGPAQFLRFEGGLVEAGHAGDSFCFDNELPRHRVWLEPYALAERLVTCGEYAEFMEDGGYRRAELWLRGGWNAVQRNAWFGPVVWSRGRG